MTLLNELNSQIQLGLQAIDVTYGEVHHLGFLLNSNVNLEYMFECQKIVYHDLMGAEMGYLIKNNLIIELIKPSASSILYSGVPKNSLIKFDHVCYKTKNLSELENCVKISEFYTELFDRKVAFYLDGNMKKIELILI